MATASTAGAASLNVRARVKLGLWLVLWQKGRCDDVLPFLARLAEAFASVDGNEVLARSGTLTVLPVALAWAVTAAALRVLLDLIASGDLLDELLLLSEKAVDGVPMDRAPREAIRPLLMRQHLADGVLGFAGPLPSRMERLCRTLPRWLRLLSEGLRARSLPPRLWAIRDTLQPFDLLSLLHELDLLALKLLDLSNAPLNRLLVTGRFGRLAQARLSQLSHLHLLFVGERTCLFATLLLVWFHSAFGAQSARRRPRVALVAAVYRSVIFFRSQLGRSFLASPARPVVLLDSFARALARAHSRLAFRVGHARLHLASRSRCVMGPRARLGAELRGFILDWPRCRQVVGLRPSALPSDRTLV